MSSLDAESAPTAYGGVVDGVGRLSPLKVEEEKEPPAGQGATLSPNSGSFPRLPAPDPSPGTTFRTVKPEERLEEDFNEAKLSKQEQEDGTYSGSSSGEDDDESDDEDQDDADEEGGTASSLVPTVKVENETSLWTSEVNAAMRAGLAKFPYLGKGKCRFAVLGQKLGRAGILAEFIRRQTGEVRTGHQINMRLPYLRNTVDDADLNRLVTRKVDKHFLDSHDWEAELGPDLFPHTKLSSTTAVAKKKRKQPAAPKPSLKVAIPGRQQLSSGPSAASSPQPPLKRIKQEHSQNYPQNCFPFPPFYSPHYPPYPLFHQPYPAVPPFSTAFHPQAVPAFPLARKFSAPAPSSSEDEPDVAPLKPSHLVAFLSTAFPSHDFTSAAAALYSSGVSTMEAVAELLLLEDETLDDFFNLFGRRAKLSGIEAGWTKKALKKLRMEVATSLT